MTPAEPVLNCSGTCTTLASPDTGTSAWSLRDMRAPGRDRRDRHLLWRLSRFRARRRGNVVICAKGGHQTPLVPGLRVGAAGYPSARDQATVWMALFAPMAAPPPEFSFHRPKPQVRDLSGAAGLIHLIAQQLQQLSLRRRHPGKVPVPIRPAARLPGR